MKTRGLIQRKSDFFHYLFAIQLKLVRRPDPAFGELLLKPDSIRIGIIFVGSVFVFCFASLMVNPTGQPVTQAAVLVLNILGMVLIEIVLGYILIAILNGTFVSLKSLSAIYAAVWATMLLIAWVPFTLWITEPWKWVLVGIGLKRHYKLKGRKAVLIVLCSIVAIVWMFNRFIPLGVANNR